MRLHASVAQHTKTDCDMKLLHTSDWHIGQQFFGFDRKEEHRRFFEQLAETVGQERPDLMVVSGDIFHTSTPSADALRLFVDGLLDVCSRHPAMRTIVTAGNHDSAMRLEADKALWKDKNVSIVGAFPRDSKGKLAPEKFIIEIPDVALVAAVPYVSPRFIDYRREMFEKIGATVEGLNGNGLPVIYMAHTSVASSEQSTSEEYDDSVGGVDYVDIEDFGHAYDYLALGHIHKPMTIKGSGGRARYCGSPIAVSFDETHQHGVDIVEVRNGETPVVRTISIEQSRGALTLPEEPVPFDEALMRFGALDDNCRDYVRLNVEVESYLPVDAYEKAGKVADGKQCRMCQIMSTPKNKPAEYSSKRMTISEFKEVSPMDIAKTEYKRKFGIEMPDVLSDMLRSVIETVESGN